MKLETSCEDLLRETVSDSEGSIAGFASSCVARRRRPPDISERTWRAGKCFCAQGLRPQTIVTCELATSG